MGSPLLTTGKAARMCSVKPDTVLKWIKKGVLPATRTMGGHYRVEEQDLLQVLAPEDGSEGCGEDNTLCSRPMRCWEYLSNSPGVECQECVVYKTHATWCFRLVGVVKGAGHTRRFCSGLCQECPYYRRVHCLPANVLVVSQDEALIRELAKKENDAVAFRFARRGYDASATIAVFRPAFVVIDQAILEDLGMALLDALASDPRARGTRIIVAVRKGSMGLRTHNRAVYAMIEEPFHADDLVAIVNRIPVETLADEA
ncbi:MAG: excisionase family DNA-binding protein [Candidatus Sulfopaludibacter sp.]|nr:excisionase family DNA-binding protein [Candidatus Sulfopaludibacter sp.]